MFIKPTQMFQSPQSGNIIKVTKIARSPQGEHRRDRCLVSDTENSRVIKGTSRVIYADSIRRRYFKV